MIYQDGKPVGVQGIARDISERKQAEQALRQLNARLEEEASRIAHALHDEAGQLLARSISPWRILPASCRPPPGSGSKRFRCCWIRSLNSCGTWLTSCVRSSWMISGSFLRSSSSPRECRSGRASRSRSTPRWTETSVVGRDRVVPDPSGDADQREQTREGRPCPYGCNKDAGLISCSIGDDGIGFDPSRCQVAPNKAGLGLLGIRERLVALGGTLAIATGPGKARPSRCEFRWIAGASATRLTDVRPTHAS